MNFYDRWRNLIRFRDLRGARTIPQSKKGYCRT